jgi:hypothetical protein
MREIRLENIRDPKLRLQAESFLKLAPLANDKITAYPELFEFLREHFGYPPGTKEFYYNGVPVVKIRK